MASHDFCSSQRFMKIEVFVLLHLPNTLTGRAECHRFAVRPLLLRLHCCRLLQYFMQNSSPCAAPPLFPFDPTLSLDLAPGSASCMFTLSRPTLHRVACSPRSSNCANAANIEGLLWPNTLLTPNPSPSQSEGICILSQRKVEPVEDLLLLGSHSLKPERVKSASKERSKPLRKL